MRIYLPFRFLCETFLREGEIERQNFRGKARRREDTLNLECHDDPQEAHRWKNIIKLLKTYTVEQEDEVDDEC